MFSEEEFSLRSPGFPHDYPHGTRCEYLVRKYSPEVCGLEMKFAHFDLEKGPGCSYDYLDIGHKALCGQLPTGFTRKGTSATCYQCYIVLTSFENIIRISDSPRITELRDYNPEQQSLPLINTIGFIKPPRSLRSVPNITLLQYDWLTTVEKGVPNNKWIQRFI